MRILEELAQCKAQFGDVAARRAEVLLERLQGMRFTEAVDLIRLHETALFLRAYPQTECVARLADSILFSFGDRMRRIDLDAFDDPEISGIAGTAVSTTFSHEFARSLVTRHGNSVEIDWENFANPGRLGVVLGRLIPLAYEDYSVEPHVDWRAWMKSAGRDLRWLIDRVDPATYELLEIPLRWVPGDFRSRSALRLPRRKPFYHSGPFLKRGDVSIESEFASSPIPLRRLSKPEVEAVLGIVVDASAVRYRELYGFQHPDAAHVHHVDLGRGVDMYFFGAARDSRLPLRAYHSGMFFKNGVPMGYVETLSLFERCETGFNLYYTFREGETAWLYLRIMKLLREQLGVTCFSIDPYQLGHDNEEAIASGAFWFYYKLGFRPVAREVATLAEREEKKIASRPSYRTTAAILRRLAVAPLFYGKGGEDWEGFQFRNLGMKFSGLGEEAARAKHGAEETGYLRLLQRRPDLRSRLLKAGTKER